MIPFLSKLSDGINSIVEKIAVLLVVVLTIVTSIGVINRFVFGKPIVWIYETSSVLFAWAMFMGVSVAFKKDEHIQLDFLVNYVSEKYKKVVLIIIKLIVVAFLVISVKDGIEIVKTTAPQKYNTINLSTAWFYAAFTVNAVFSLIHLIDSIMKMMFVRENVLDKDKLIVIDKVV